jgi:hypothetical protein
VLLWAGKDADQVTGKSYKWTGLVLNFIVQKIAQKLL